jgi:uncharacterized protein YkwD
MKISVLWICIVCSSLGVNAQDGAPHESIGHEKRAEQLHQSEPIEIWEHPAVNARIDFDSIDYDLLAAVVFHETNRQRAIHGLPALSYHHELREAARIQARGMQKEGQISHEHPHEEKETLADRMEYVGLKGRYFSENVAMVFGRQYKSGEPFFSRKTDGRQIVSATPGGPPIPPHTYRSFARNLVGSWMDSPSHRQNILATEAEMLGTESLHVRGPEGMDRFYCVQVFYAPFEMPVRARK